MAGKRYFEIGFVNNSHSVNFFLAEFTESVLNILSYLESTIKLPMVGSENIFKILRRLKALLSDWLLKVQHFITDPYIS